KARRAGGKGATLDELQREAAKALVEATTVLANGHKEWVTSANFVDAQHVVTTSWDKTVRLWDLKNGQSKLLVTESAKVATANFSRSGEKFVTATWSGGCNVWRRNGDLIAKLDHGGHRVNSAELSAAEQRE